MPKSKKPAFGGLCFFSSKKRKRLAETLKAIYNLGVNIITYRQRLDYRRRCTDNLSSTSIFIIARNTAKATRGKKNRL